MKFFSFLLMSGVEVLEELGLIRLISSDSHEFVVESEVLKMCDVLHRMVENKQFVEGKSRVFKV